MFVLYSSEPYYQATTDTRLGEENKGHQLLTKMGERAVKYCDTCTCNASTAAALLKNNEASAKLTTANGVTFT